MRSRTGITIFPETVTLSGHTAEQWRQFLKKLNKDTVKKALQQTFWDAPAGAIEIDEFDFLNQNTTRKPLIFTFRYRVQDINLEMGPERLLVKPVLMSLSQLKPLLSKKRRKTPIQWPGLFALSEKTKMILPDYLVFETVPGGSSIANGLVTTSYSTKQIPGGIMLQRELKVVARTIPQKWSEAVLTGLRDFIHKSSQPLLARKK